MTRQVTIYRVRRITPENKIADTRWYSTGSAAHRRARRWQSLGWDVTVERAKRRVDFALDDKWLRWESDL